MERQVLGLERFVVEGKGIVYEKGVQRYKVSASGHQYLWQYLWQ